MAEQTANEVSQEPWNPVGEFAACIKQPDPEEQQIGRVLWTLNAVLGDAILCADRAGIMKLQSSLSAEVLRAKGLGDTKHRIYGIAAAEIMISIMAHVLRHMRPPEQDEWVRKSVTAREIITLLTYDTIVHINQIVRRTGRPVRSVKKVIDRMEAAGLARVDRVDERNVYCGLLPAGVQLQESIWLKERRALEKKRRRRSS